MPSVRTIDYKPQEDYVHKKDDDRPVNHTVIQIDEDDDENPIFYDAESHLPTAKNVATGYAVMVGATIGYFTGYGIIPGVIVPAIDEALIRYGYEKEHWLAKTALSIAWVGTPISTALSSYIGLYAAPVAIVSSIAFIKFSSDIFDQRANILPIVEGASILQKILDPEGKISSKELFKIIGKLKADPIDAINIAKEDIAYVMNNQLVQNILLHVISGALTVGLDQWYMSYTSVATNGAAINFILSTIGSNSEVKESYDYYTLITTVIGYGGLYLLKNCIQSALSMHLQSKDNALKIHLESLVRNKIYDRNNIIATVDENGLGHDDIITNSPNDITQMLQWDIYRLNKMVDKCAATPGSLSIICRNDYTFVLSMHMIQANIVNKINEWVNQHIPDSSHLDTKISQIKSTSLTNFREVVCSNNDGLISSKLEDLLQQKNQLAMSSQLFQSISQNLQPLVNLLFTCADVLYFLQRIVAHTTNISDVQIILQNIDMFAASAGSVTILSEKIQKQRLKILFSKKLPNPKLRTLEIDEKSYDVKFTNYTLKGPQKTYIHIDNIKFTVGYNVVNAPSGAGKSSILQDLIYPLSGNMICTGTVELPCTPENIIYISQKGFLLPSGVASIFESITSLNASKIDDTTKSLLKTEILSLADQIGLSLDESKLFSQEYNLSGGEGKKVCIIKAILKSRILNTQNIKPVVILDEPFNELDEGSVHLAENALKQHIPKTAIVIIVDHNLQHNNHTLDDGRCFYDAAFTLDDHGSLDHSVYSITGGTEILEDFVS